MTTVAAGGGAKDPPGRSKLPEDSAEITRRRRADKFTMMSNQQPSGTNFGLNPSTAYNNWIPNSYNYYYICEKTPFYH